MAGKPKPMSQIKQLICRDSWLPYFKANLINSNRHRLKKP
jgi:hypothetical protein